MLTADNTTQEIAAARPEIAVWGIGAVEQHGPALPVGTDWIAVSELTHRVAERLDALLVPALPFSMSECHGGMHGSVWLKPWTLAAVVRDVVRSLRAQGISQVVIINGHGGNFVLEATICELNATYDDVIVIMPPFELPGPEEAPIYTAAGREVHAGESETSSQLYINRRNVREQRVDFIPPVGREFLDYATMEYISPHGVWGLSSYATAEKGERGTERRVERLVAYIRDTFARLETLRGG